MPGAKHPATVPMPDATLAHRIRPGNSRAIRRPDKAFTPHPAMVPNAIRRPDKAFTPHPAMVPNA
ncbi:MULTISPECIES: hypothetical protein [Escherichia]|nr:hypothetical protein [Escherichia sp. 14.0993]